MNFFILGNSFSRNATCYLPELVAEVEYSLHLGRAIVGGCSLQRHWEHVEAAERGEAQGRFYDGKTLRELLAAGEWDIVMLHQASMPSSDVESYRPYARLLHDFIKELQPQAEVVLHQTWAYRCDAPIFGEVGNGKNARDHREMWECSRAAYHTIAGELGVRLMPLGDAFWMVASDPEWGYRPDPDFDFEHPVFPNLPDQTNSLHAGYYWSEDKQFNLDHKHASEAGCYLGSLMWYGFLFGDSPENITFVPPDVAPNFAAHLRSVATKTLRKNGVTLNTAR